MTNSADERLAEIAAKAVKETRYHLRYSSDWLVRLGDGTEESHARVQSALERLWPYTVELFEEDDLDREMADCGIAPRLAEVRAAWSSRIEACSPRRPSSGPVTGRIRGSASAASTANISATCSPTCNTCSEPIRERAGERGLADAARSGRRPTPDDRIAAAWRALSAVEDPEIPALSLVDLGIIRFVETQADGVLRVGLSPDLHGMPGDGSHPAVGGRGARGSAGRGVCGHAVLSPAWTSDWITPEGRRKLAAYGIVPPAEAVTSARQVLRETRPIACPRCSSVDTECISQFGSTPCKALHRCRQCLEPFEYFKCI